MTSSMKEAFEKAQSEFVKKELRKATFKLMKGRLPTNKELKQIDNFELKIIKDKKACKLN